MAKKKKSEVSPGVYKTGLTAEETDAEAVAQETAAELGCAPEVEADKTEQKSVAGILKNRPFFLGDVVHHRDTKVIGTIIQVEKNKQKEITKIGMKPKNEESVHWLPPEEVIFGIPSEDFNK